MEVSLKNFLKKHDIKDIIPVKKGCDKSKFNEKSKKYEKLYFVLNLFISNPLKHKEIDRTIIENIIKKEKIDMINCSAYYNSCLNCLKGAPCFKTSKGSFIEYPIEDTNIIICFSDKRKRKKGKGFTRTFSFHLNFNFSCQNSRLTIKNVLPFTYDEPEMNEDKHLLDIIKIKKVKPIVRIESPEEFELKDKIKKAHIEIEKLKNAIKIEKIRHGIF